MTALRERRGQEEKQGDHVGEHGGRSGLLSKLRSELTNESSAARGLPGRTERSHPDVRRQLVPADAGAEHGHVLELLGERRDEVERVGEDGMVGVERLGDKDESQLASRPAAIVCSASWRSERANSSGV